MLQCDKCNKPVDWNDDHIYVGETKVYCESCTIEIFNLSRPYTESTEIQEWSKWANITLT